MSFLWILLPARGTESTPDPGDQKQEHGATKVAWRVQYPINLHPANNNVHVVKRPFTFSPAAWHNMCKIIPGYVLVSKQL